jgi:Cu-Zn family superoxide dismutase
MKEAIRIAALTATALTISACAARQPKPEPAPSPEMATASADIRDSGGRTLARASATEVGDAVRVRIDAAGLPAGIYGAHIHTTGNCTPPTFDSAGPHWNPTQRQHGRDNPQGRHLGDLPNLMVGTNGQGSFEFTIAGASLGSGPRPILDGDGAAVVVHARADDNRTDPSGNSGTRIGCGTLR